MAKPVFLMCRPTYYGIDYEINPWMDRRRQADRDLALRQWQALRRTLVRELGATVLTCRARPGLPDMCFTANAGLVRGNVVVPSRFRYRERAGEAPHFTHWFRRRGWRLASLPGDVRFEGEGDALFVGRRLFAGYYHRSDVQAHVFLSQALKAPVVSLELVNRYFYHLDTCFAPLGPNSAVYYPGAFDRYGLRVLAQSVGDLIPVTRAEAYHFAANLVAVGRKVVIPEPPGRLCRLLTRRGYTVYGLDLSEFVKAGGAAKCLVLRLR